ncbi:uncharacterized protein [Amphiura filiformis]|uniref:uncharacterized protein n=1 Tax=Amphiura filiformis TaxID=82378 RepID=UPI003B219126
MNQLAVRTHQGEYYAGDMIYGIIYLKVEDPDKIKKLNLKISGTEMCQFVPDHESNQEERGDGDHANEFLANPSSDKIMEHPMQVMTQDETLQAGIYRIPFQYQLRPKLPGSTKIQCPGNIPASIQSPDYVPSAHNSWEGAIRYSIIVSASEDLQASQPFVCLGSRPKEVLNMAYREETTIRSCFCYDRGILALTTELDKISYMTGDTARLKIVVENSTSEEVKAVKYSLKRTTEIQGWWVSQADHTTDGSLLYARGKQERVTIEAGVDIHTRNLGNAKPKETSRWECDLHLVDQDNQPLPPTARGKYLKIQYAILVEVSVSRANDLTTVIPLPYVLPQANREWEEWEPAEWMKKCTLHRAHEKIAVRNSTLESPVYEELP